MAGVNGKIDAPLGSRRGRVVPFEAVEAEALESIGAWLGRHPGSWVAVSGVLGSR